MTYEEMKAKWARQKARRRPDDEEHRLQCASVVPPEVPETRRPAIRRAQRRPPRRRHRCPPQGRRRAGRSERPEPRPAKPLLPRPAHRDEDPARPPARDAAPIPAGRRGRRLPLRRLPRLRQLPRRGGGVYEGDMITLIILECKSKVK